ncbi:hypothetical protein NEUTE1DRAFT_97972 [Neurospora tetrasperma FGSC 2508]|uniref:Uncharacterized protein n=1 Tax=Neurospora tetrasperma (strain FGSC 2508 / ATCC MYA-4615 / P0657) TaxID=510951 RepID=F8MEI5_NEUT8|nr:uncharacterized protein NEUTE1DRAFT_97972 [Neurospora tetrasperma FGSC 2508]EGO60816.1 hypothetical protein NEUTE1DRAFT_97972 [Neurospora tetrasperma FGSC 2508]EGZ75195.1 hypothetical protein NEUTE2DRAFT_56653 [Neurospora tetrasperma FGSC 2509]
MGSMWQLASSASLAGELEKDGMKWGMPRGGVHWRKEDVDFRLAPMKLIIGMSTGR